MKLNTTKQIRRTAICVATAIAIAAPGLTSAAFGDRARGAIQTVKTRTGVLITNVQENRPLASRLETARENTEALFETVKQLQVVEQLQQTVQMIKQMQADYDYFSGGAGCGAHCASFRSSLKNILNSYITLMYEIPALSGERGLIENIERVTNLVDYIPPRALYLMWQALSAKIAELETSADEIRQTLASLPPMTAPSGFGSSNPSVAMDTSSAGGSTASSTTGYCSWKDKEDDPVVKMIRARLELMGWTLEQFEDMIPDVEVKAEAGGTAGVAVANGAAAAGVAVQPTDGVKLALKLIAFIPQRISKSIEMNILQANVICS